MPGLHAPLPVPYTSGHKIQPRHLGLSNENCEVAVNLSGNRATSGRVLHANNNHNNGLDGNNINNDARFAGIGQAPARTTIMSGELWERLCSYQNLELAFKKARKHKTLKPYVIEFEKKLQDNLLLLRTELLLHSYRPQPLRTFILRDPKTRKISKSEFRDRVVHHALCNVIEPIFEKSFVYDSYANRKGKGTLKALERLESFKLKATKNNTRTACALKADIRQYFENVDHTTLLKIAKENVQDRRILWLIETILANYGKNGKGMPLGNLTSQFLANVYLNKLDWFVKQTLNARHYLRYVDDFVILDASIQRLEQHKHNIELFLATELGLELHPGKSTIREIRSGIGFLGFRIFHQHKLLKKSSERKLQRKLTMFKHALAQGTVSYDKVYSSFEGWLAHARHGNTYNVRRKIINKFDALFGNKTASVEISRWLQRAESAKSSKA